MSYEDDLLIRTVDQFGAVFYIVEVLQELGLFSVRTYIDYTFIVIK